MNAIQASEPRSQWNGTAAEYPREVCLHQIFESWVDRTPRAMALVVGRERLSYRELDDRANQLAHYLKGRGVGRGMYVGICMHRCSFLIISILAVLKAGGAYVPLDASYPPKRLIQMIEASGLTLLIVGGRQYSPEVCGNAVTIDSAEFAAAAAGMPRERLPFPGNTSDLAYLVFTSGTTGRAKGAKVTQRGWTNLLCWFQEHYSIADADRVLVVSSLCFDITQRSIMMPLTSGGQLHLLAAESFEPELVIQTVRDEHITIINSAPSMFYAILEWPVRESGAMRTLRWVFLGGEPIIAGRLVDWVRSADCRARIANVYGVAECADVSAAYTLVDYDRYMAGSVPLGTPIANSRIYLLNEGEEEVPQGQVAEICIGGDGVGAGYEGDPELTRKKFVSDRFAGQPGAMMYRTGDLGRIAEDGNLEYRGRIDHQVKIAGVRIELGDVEAAIRSHPDVRDVVAAAADESGERSLVAFVIFNDARDTVATMRSVRAHLQTRLPSAMVPRRMVPMTSIPLTPNGKVDRGALLQSATTDV